MSVEGGWLTGSVPPGGGNRPISRWSRRHRLPHHIHHLHLSPPSIVGEINRLVMAVMPPDGKLLVIL
ncbi:hypothetical protein Tco_1437792 [Tanacetum coccineum]